MSDKTKIPIMEIFDSITLPQGRAKKKKKPPVPTMTVSYYGKIGFNHAARDLLGLQVNSAVSFGHDGRDLYVLPGQVGGYPLKEVKSNLNISHQVLVERILGFVKKVLLKEGSATYRFLISAEPQDLPEGGVGWVVITSSCEAITKKHKIEKP